MGKREIMKSFVKNLVYAILVFVVLSALFSLMRAPKDAIETVALSQLAAQVNEGIVKEIAVENNDLSITLSDDKKEKAKMDNEASLPESSKNYRVDAEK